MESTLLDTDVFSFVFKQDTRASLYAAELAGSQICVCFQTVAELRHWALVRGWGDSRRQSLDLALSKCVVFPSDDAMAHQWAQLTMHRRRIGEPIECGDAWIAAAALRHDVTLFTHNGKHYAAIPNLRLVTHGLGT